MRGGIEKQNFLFQKISESPWNSGTIFEWWDRLKTCLYEIQAAINPDTGKAYKKTVSVYNNIRSFSLALHRLSDRGLIEENRKRINGNSKTLVYSKK